MNGNHVCWLMRNHKVTIRMLAARMGISLKRVRHVREHGVTEAHICRDWIEGITGRDPEKKA